MKQLMIVLAFAAGSWGCTNAMDIGASEFAMGSKERPKKRPVLCRVTGGGQIVAGENPDSFGGNAQPFQSDVDGEWNHVTHDGLHFHGDPRFIQCFNVPDHAADPPEAPANAAIFGGTGRLDGEEGCEFLVYVEDHGEPGFEDFYAIEITCRSGASYAAGDTLLHGNIQIHDVPPGHTSR